MDFQIDALLGEWEAAGEIRKDPKKAAAQITVKSYIKGTFAAMAVPTALSFALADHPVMVKAPDFSDKNNGTLVSSITASQTVSLGPQIVVTTSGDNVTIGKDGNPWIFKSLVR